MIKTTVEKHFDKIAKDYDKYTGKRDLHYTTLKKILQTLIGKDKEVLEVGCGTGDIIASLKAKHGYGQDISSEMIKIASEKYDNCKRITFSTKWPLKTFDYIFMSDVIEHLENRSYVFNKVSKHMTKKSHFINSMMNPLWIPIESIYTFLGLKMPEGPNTRVGYSVLEKEIQDAGLKIIKHDYKLLIPIKIPVITRLMNTYLEKYLKKLAFIEYFVAVKA